MARLAAQENMEYFPTPVSQVEKFARIFKPNLSRAAMFDPCCGEGTALKALYDAWNMRGSLIGCELDGVRAKEAKGILDHVHNVPFEYLQLEVGNLNITFANPPYDEVQGQRTEIAWISRIADMMEYGDYLILVLPDHYFNRSKWEKKLLMLMYHKRLNLYEPSYSEKVGVIPFDDEEYPRFRQGFLVLKKGSYSTKLLDVMPVEKNLDEYKRNHTLDFPGTSWQTSKDYTLGFTVVEQEPAESIMSEDNYHLIFGETSGDVPVQPLQKMSTEIMAVAIAGGMFSGIEIDDFVIRGGTRTEIKEFTTKTESGATEEHEKEELIAFISELNKTTGDLVQYPSTSEEFGNQIERLAKLIAEKMERDNPPVYNHELHFAKYEADLMEIRSPHKIPGVEHDGLLPPQFEKAATILRGYDTGLKSCVLIGEMGTGKSVTSLAIAWASVKHRPAHLQKVVILLPPKTDLVDKWGAEEIDMAFRDIPHLTVELTSIDDARRAFAHEGLTFMLIRETMAKRTSGWEKIKRTRRCHVCGRQYKPVNAHGNEVTKEKEFSFCSECKNDGVVTKLFTFSRTGKLAKKDSFVDVKDYIRKRYEPKNKKEGEQIQSIVEAHLEKWHADYNFSGRAYASVASYIKDHYSGQYYLIVDEAHQYKGADTARGYAAGAIMAGAHRSIIMTGTIYNGYASSLFYTLYRSQYLFRNQWGYDEQSRFVAFFGLQDKITKSVGGEGSWSGYAKKITRVEEKPGIHPSMVTMMLPYTVFMKLSEFDNHIPPQESYTLFVDMDDKPFNKVTEFLSDVKSAAVDELTDENIKSMSLMSQFTWANSGTWDVYPDGDIVASNATQAVFTLEPSKVYMTAKEEAILRLVQFEKRQGFPTLIFYTQFDRRPIQNRLMKLFTDYGMKLVPMPASEDERKPFIIKAISEGADAILCNANLVREGIDLLMFRNIIWAAPTPDSILVNQANQRNHRLGQTEITKVYYLGWNKTYQAEQWTRTAEKVSAMSTMHGDVRQGLAALLGTENLVTQVQERMIDFDTYASDLSIDDLPELIKAESVTIVKQEEKPIPVKVVEAEEWRPRGWEDFEAASAAQLSFF